MANDHVTTTITLAIIVNIAQQLYCYCHHWYNVVPQGAILGHAIGQPGKLSGDH